MTTHRLFCIAALLLVGCSRLPEEELSVLPDAVPFVLTATPRPLLSISDEEIESFQGRFQPHLRAPESKVLLPSQSLSIHVLHVAGPNGRFDDLELVDSRAVVRTFLDDAFGEAVYGQAPLRETRYGLRFLPQSVVTRLNGRASETHDHQTLAALAELGLPLSQALRVRGNDRTFGEVLTDAVANFYPDKRELAWTAMAFTAYLPPQSRWVNKFGEVFTFDDVVALLLAEGFSQASCGGAHVLYAFVHLRAADARFGILTEPTRRRLHAAVHDASQRIAENQNPDGSWNLDWYEPHAHAAGSVDELDLRFMVTGHLGELSLYLPECERIADAVLQKAGEWILPELRARIDTHMSDQLCPLTHAFCFVRGIAKHTGTAVETRVFQRVSSTSKE